MHPARQQRLLGASTSAACCARPTGAPFCCTLLARHPALTRKNRGRSGRPVGYERVDPALFAAWRR